MKKLRDWKMQLINLNDISESDKILMNKAIEMRKFAYAPYSNYLVGAALLDINDMIHTGCNIESADYTLTTHAEMLAVDSMVKTGSKSIKKIAVALKGNLNPVMPCGLCRQKLSEFALFDIIIISINLDETDNITYIYQTHLSELLPYAFNSLFLNKL
jgi:cytidine deaminase